MARTPSALRWLAPLLMILALGACEDDPTPAADAGAGCSPACGACETCDLSGEAPACVSACGAGTSCQAGACVATPVTCDPGCGPCQLCGADGRCQDTCPEGVACVDGACAPAGCEPACGDCETCDLSGAAPACRGLCGAGAVCEGGACVSARPAACEPGCGPCEACDTSGETPTCQALCAAGARCVDGRCAPIPPPACEPGCSPCQRCDVSGETTTCVDNCGPGLSCNEAGVCEAPPPAACDPGCGPCETCDVSGEAPVCVGRCGVNELCVDGACRRDGVHARMDALAGPFANPKAVTAACLECHQDAAEHLMRTPHWNWAGPSPGMVGAEQATTFGKKNLINNFCIAVPSNEARCTQCHAGYDWRDDAYDHQDARQIDCLVCHAQPSLYNKAPTTAGNPVEGTNLEAAARSVGHSESGNCGKCHFGAGGGDNVKKGDLGSHLLRASREDDVHLGRGMACADCHGGERHQILGRSVHNVARLGTASCTDCHVDAPHENPVLNDHGRDIACQTCHIPAYSRTQPTKMYWDWATAGDRTRGENGIERSPVGANAVQVVSYDAMKGDFVWATEVRPEYGWWDGRAERMTITDTFPEGAGTEENPVILARPVAGFNDAEAKIWPFKIMRGRQALDPARRLVIVPKLFGPGGFWPQIPTPENYSAQAVEALWARALTAGARVAGQIGADEAYQVGDWSWGYTEMWMGINHEVAPPARALDCGDCHNNPAFSFEGLGYNCDPLIGGIAACGSRNRN